MLIVNSLAPLLGRTLVVVSHPDDECVACGALLQRMADPIVFYLTGGVPRDRYFWERHGSPEAYAAVRRQEAQRALECVGVRRVEFAPDRDGLSTVLVDQELFRVLPAAWSALASAIRQFEPQALLTLAYEGGHPDHDSCNLLVSVASRSFGLPAWEAPLYNRATADRPSHQPEPQNFVRENGSEIDVEPTPPEIERKLAMWKQYPSQGDFLRVFSPLRETLRPLPVYDYSAPPHEGQLNYERWQWPMTGGDVCRAFTSFLEEFKRGLPRASNSAGRADIHT